MILWFFNVAVIFIAAGVVFWFKKGDNHPFDLFHQISRAADEIKAFAEAPGDLQQKQINLILWICGGLIVALSFTNIFGAVVAGILGVILGNWVGKEPVRPSS